MKPHGNPLQLDVSPMQLLAQLDPAVRVLMLHSGRLDHTWANCTLIGFPKITFRFTKFSAGDPFAQLRQVTKQHQRGIWIGHLSYDLGRYVETLPTQATDDRDWPIMHWDYCATYLLYDHLAKQWYQCGDQRLKLKDYIKASQTADCSISPAQSVFASREDYEQAVQKCIDYIHAGDVFQVNLTQRFTAPYTGQYPHAQRNMFASLMNHSPAWYAAYLEQLDQRVIASSSPELFLQVSTDGQVITRPIKGTLGASVSADELENSIKDQAELHMIVDLMRNDLGRVCQFGTVQVTKAREIESHPTVHHGVATVQGQLTEDKDVFDLLRATMPGGSITGAPKVRAMQIIDELEPVRRGPYCGCIGYISAEHGCSLNIAIRTMLIEQLADNSGRIDYSVGGGIVSDSVPSQEYDETRIKAQGIERALGLSK
ncbi:MAG TPA: aminodeoxychorismate synthase, component I [Phycisphaerales bacterium]|nr:aminodeoxychorismate synthase, component I [Phycisphaerales bacterium]HCD30936.1 aminodeoxychorismate synthase, component I [Phycisphaerales bacterium]|tara:strand:- start:1312 stop:2595 length:1284 start_codon:yes stop_codon:yes gene_type:complete